MRFPARTGFILLSISLAILGLTGVSQLAHAAPTQVATIRISLSSGGAQANGSSNLPSISADGRYVAFASNATNLTSNDTNDVQDVFVHDRLTGETRRVSLSSLGEQANATSYNPVISPDGRYVAFVSDATNLVSVDTNFASDVFLHDLQTGQTRRVSIASNGVQPNDHSLNPTISAGGRYVAFQSYASNLVSGDTNQYADVFVHDRWSGLTERLSVDSDDQQANHESYHPSLSADGRFAVFDSFASNLISGDTNAVADIFLRDRGPQPQPTLSADHAVGAPGSFFSMQGVNFPRESLVSLSVNGQPLTLTLNVDSNGYFSFTLDSTLAEPGYYLVRASANPSALAFIILDPAAAWIPPQGNAPIAVFPSNIGYTQLRYLPLLYR